MTIIEWLLKQPNGWCTKVVTNKIFRKRVSSMAAPKEQRYAGIRIMLCTYIWICHRISRNAPSDLESPPISQEGVFGTRQYRSNYTPLISINVYSYLNQNSNDRTFLSQTPPLFSSEYLIRYVGNHLRRNRNTIRLVSPEPGHTVGGDSRVPSVELGVCDPELCFDGCAVVARYIDCQFSSVLLDRPQSHKKKGKRKKGKWCDSHCAR